MTLLQEVVQQNPNYSRQEKVIFSVCIASWVEKPDWYNQFLLACPEIVEAFEVISHNLHLKKYPNWHQWDTESRRRACALLAGISKHLRFALIGPQLPDHCFTCVVLLNRCKDEASISWTLCDR